MKLVVILLAWVCAFLAFLVAPILLLAAAWVIAMAILAVRGHGRRSRDDHAASAVPEPAGHRFGGAA